MPDMNPVSIYLPIRFSHVHLLHITQHFVVEFHINFTLKNTYCPFLETTTPTVPCREICKDVKVKDMLQLYVCCCGACRKQLVQLIMACNTD